MASNAENVSIWWRHHDLKEFYFAIKEIVFICNDTVVSLLIYMMMTRVALANITIRNVDTVYSIKYAPACVVLGFIMATSEWRHNGRDGVSNHRPHFGLLKRLFRRRSKKTSKLRVTGLCVGNSPMTAEFPAQMASNAENVSIWWRHHAYSSKRYACNVRIYILNGRFTGIWVIRWLPRAVK